MLDLSDMDDNYCDFRNANLTELETTLVENVDQIDKILKEYFKIKYDEQCR